MKSFIDLLMGCECALKSHIMLGKKDSCPKETYQVIRNAGHSIAALADAASSNENCADYIFLKQELEGFSVKIRYALDAYDTFFPMQKKWDSLEIGYSEKIGNQIWINSIRDSLRRLIEILDSRLTGFITNDLTEIWENEEQVRRIIQTKRSKHKKQ